MDIIDCVWSIQYNGHTTHQTAPNCSINQRLINIEEW